MENKNLVATIFIKDGKAVKSIQDNTEIMDIIELARLYNDSGIDKILLLDLSDNDEEHEKNLLAMRQINRSIEIKTCGGGNIRRLEDVKKILYAGCVEAMLNGARPETVDIVVEACKRFGKDKLLVSIHNLDFVFKTKEFISDTIHEFLVMTPDIVSSLEQMTDVPYILRQDEYDIENMVKYLSSKNIRGIYGCVPSDTNRDIMQLKTTLAECGIKMDNFYPKLAWEDLKPNSDGLIPVVVQDYKTNAVLMMAYMNEDAYYATIRSGRMTYWSRSRQTLWVKGETSGHTQYVKSLTADCDYDTILAKVSQVGGIACHTGNPTCFFNNIVQKEYVERNPLKVFEDVYSVIADRKHNPKDGSYTNYLFDKGIDKILKKVGEEATEIVIAAKNEEPAESVYEISDFLYHMMVLMVEKNITWEEITRELAQR